MKWKTTPFPHPAEASFTPRQGRGTGHIPTTLCCAIFVLLGASAALAHDRLKSSSPAENAEVAAVERIKLEFTSRVRFPAVVLREADDTIVGIGKAQATGDTVTSDVPEVLSAGKYVIAWRVVSSDGHPIEGGFLHPDSSGDTV
ncbi:copper resistance protein CopC [Streptosporangium sandarakinum]|uniref:copper resistance protein CopC n=1 Tax=Streptosporangium sandarakinum TaxID=1260955 RepID=UPI0037A88EAD